MPTKKRTKKVSPKKSKKNSKLSGFLSKLNPNSPKKKLLLFVLVFGVIAGGFYAYRSYAWVGGRGSSITHKASVRNLSRYGGFDTSYAFGSAWRGTKWFGRTSPVYSNYLQAGGGWSSVTVQIPGYVPNSKVCFWGFAGHASITATVGSDTRNVYRGDSFGTDGERELICIGRRSVVSGNHSVTLRANTQVYFTNVAYYN